MSTQSVGERIAEKVGMRFFNCKSPEHHRLPTVVGSTSWKGLMREVAALIDQELLAAQKISGSETPTESDPPREETGHDNYEDTKPYCCRYFHNGGWWGVDIHAFDDEDAAARVAKLGNLQLLGELKMEIPANRASGIFVRLLCTIRNLFYAPKM